MPRIAPVLAVVFASFVVAAPARAHTERTSSTGAPVRWKADVVHVVADASMDELGPEALDAAAAAFGAWAAVDGAHAPDVVIERGDADAEGWHEGGANRCTLRYAKHGSDLAGDALAVTVLSYGDDGVIVDADIVVNGGKHRRFAVLPSVPLPGEERYDLQNVLTHEVGHFFGLGEEPEQDDDTMFVTSARGETKKRDLAIDDAAGLVSLYGADAETVGAACSVGAPGGRDAGLGAALAIALALAAARRRR